MAIFLYTLIFVAFSPIMIFVIWLLIKYHRRKDAIEEAREDAARLEKLEAKP